MEGNILIRRLDELVDENARLRDHLRKRVEELERDYHELLYCVGKHYEGETRHQTALRYLRKAEEGNDDPDCPRKGGG
jgi:flagellar biosynthesis chaperone FliJ